MTDDPLQLSSLKRGLRALWILNVRKAQTASDLARELRIPRTTARRVLDTLASEGYLEKDPRHFTYRITPVISLLAAGFCAEDWISQVATPLLARATEATIWPLSIATLVGTQLTVLATSVFRKSHAHLAVGTGASVPILRRAGGYVMLAFMAPHRRELMLRMVQSPAGAERLSTEQSPQLRSIIKAIQAQRVAQLVDRSGREASVAVPILYAGVAYACLEMRYDRSAIAPALIRSSFVPKLQALVAQSEWRPHVSATTRS